MMSHESWVMRDVPGGLHDLREVARQLVTKRVSDAGFLLQVPRAGGMKDEEGER